MKPLADKYYLASVPPSSTPKFSRHRREIQPLLSFGLLPLKKGEIIRGGSIIFRLYGAVTYLPCLASLRPVNSHVYGFVFAAVSEG